MVHLLLQTQTSNPATQDGFLSAWQPLWCLAPAWVWTIGSLCDADEHTCMGHLVCLNGPESCDISLHPTAHKNHHRWRICITNWMLKHALCNLQCYLHMLELIVLLQHYFLQLASAYHPSQHWTAMATTPVCVTVML